MQVFRHVLYIYRISWGTYFSKKSAIKQTNEGKTSEILKKERKKKKEEEEEEELASVLGLLLVGYFHVSVSFLFLRFLKLWLEKSGSSINWVYVVSWY